MTKQKMMIISILCGVALLITGAVTLFQVAWDFARKVPEEEAALRMEVVQTAESWMGANEKDGSHREIIDLYNAHAPLARGYAVTYEDAWCATFDSAVAIQCGLTDLIPTECGCTPQIELFQEMGCWQEADDYVPLPGDFIFYHWNCTSRGDCTERADHVGIVTGTIGPFIKVIEGNKDDDVSYRIVLVNARSIRGYGVPDYGTKSRMQ